MTDMEITYYVVDAYTGSVYAGSPDNELVAHYHSRNKRAYSTPRSVHNGDIQPVLVRSVTKGDVSDLQTVWSVVPVELAGPAPIPGEWKIVHLETEV